MLEIKRVQVIINPAAGRDDPILKPLNSAFHGAGIDWDVSITKGRGDAARLAKQAVEQGVDVVAAYGGDGTVTEVGSELLGTEVLLAILPGGTANVMAVELGIPADPLAACALLTGSDCAIRPVDAGKLDDEVFLLRVGTGLEAAMVEGAAPELKYRVGSFAYALAALRALRDPELAQYELTLDGEQVEADGLACIIANSGNLGVRGLSLHPSVDVSDGRLDVFVIRGADLNSLLSVAASVAGSEGPKDAMPHWQVQKVRLRARPAQSIQVDGEILGKTPIEAEILPQALQVIVPAGSAGEEGEAEEETGVSRP